MRAQKEQSKPKAESCGFGGSIHNCHCADRVEKIRHEAVKQCINSGDETAYNLCLRRVLAGKGHCDIAERSTEFDRDVNGDWPTVVEGDSVKSPMGEYCKRACKPHHCGCAEQSCDFK